VFKLADRGVELRDAYDRAVAAAADPGSWDNCVRQYKKHKQKASTPSQAPKPAASRARLPPSTGTQAAGTAGGTRRPDARTAADAWGTGGVGERLGAGRCGGTGAVYNVFTFDYGVFTLDSLHSVLYWLEQMAQRSVG
jgi:hypothetical protein